jgi:hypothetical protein
MKEREFIDMLRVELKTYDDVTETIRKRKQRIIHTNAEADPCQDDVVLALQKIKSKSARTITKLLEEWPIWQEWLAQVPGVGPFVAGNLIMLYYYRHVPVCKCGARVEKKESTFYCPVCKKSIRGDGVVAYDVERRNFSTVSAWWAYMGRHTVDGKMPKRTKGQVSNWSSLGRMIGYQFGDQVNRQPERNPYKAFMLARKAKRERTHPEASKGHRHNMAKNETIKLFLSHFWHVARTLEGLDTRGPYAQQVLQHDGIIAPYYWEGAKQAAA